MKEGEPMTHPYEILMRTETHEQRMARIMADRHLIIGPTVDEEDDLEPEPEGEMTTVGAVLADTTARLPQNG